MVELRARPRHDVGCAAKTSCSEDDGASRADGSGERAGGARERAASEERASGLGDHATTRPRARAKLAPAHSLTHTVAFDVLLSARAEGAVGARGEGETRREEADGHCTRRGDRDARERRSSSARPADDGKEARIESVKVLSTRVCSGRRDVVVLEEGSDKKAIGLSTRLPVLEKPRKEDSISVQV